MNKKIIVIVGPTGVGKTRLSIELAKVFNGEIINADSTQVYKYLNIGTSKIKEEEKEGIPHHLIDIISPQEKYTIYDYQKEGRKIIDNILNRGKTPIVVGGSGLYIKSLLFNYEFNYEEESVSFESYADEYLYSKLLELDPVTDVSKNNRKKIEREIDFYNKNGFPISMNNKGKDELLYDIITIGLTTGRDELYDRIRKKTEVMFEEGLLSEARALYEDYPHSHIINSAIGYKELINYFKEELPLEEAIASIKSNSTSYAKRQYTWFNNQMKVTWFNVNFKNFDETINEVRDYIKKNISEN